MKKKLALQGVTPNVAFTVFCCCLLVTGMVFSPFLLSISMWGLVIAALWHAAETIYSTEDRTIKQVGLAQMSLQVLIESFLKFFQRPTLALLSLLLVITAVSGLWSDDSQVWLERLRVRIPFFVLPFCFANLPKLTAFQQKGILCFLVWVLFFTCIGVGIHYCLHFKDIMQGMYEGRSIPVPRNHIRFNLILAMGILCGGWLAAEKFALRYRWEPVLMWGITAFLFFFIHVLSVRSGLGALYLALFFTIIRIIVLQHRWILGLGSLTLLLLLPAIAIKTLPSLEQKMNYMRWDWGQFRQSTGATYSDSERFISLQGGWELVKVHPLLGVGTGDLPAEMKKIVAAKFPHYQQDVKLPHNQFLYDCATTGGLGLLLTLFALYFPLFQTQYRRFYLFAAFQCIVFASFLVEYTLETSIGAAFFLFFQLFFIKMVDDGGS